MSILKYVPSSVQYVDHMGNDLAPVNAARVSFGKASQFLERPDQLFQFETVTNTARMAKGLGPISYDPRYQDWMDYALPRLNENEPVLNFTDYKLMHFLAENNHFTPFGHAVVKFRIKAPVFVARQLVKHQIGLCWNEVSRRYVDDTPEFYRMAWKERPDASIKQGSSDTPAHPPEMLFDAIPADDPLGHVTIKLTPSGFTEIALRMYEHLLAHNVAPEQARSVLPLNHMTEWVWTGSLLAWARVANLRLDAHAQRETREVAVAISEEMSLLFPCAWGALVKAA